MALAALLLGSLARAEGPPNTPAPPLRPAEQEPPAPPPPVIPLPPPPPPAEPDPATRETIRLLEQRINALETAQQAGPPVPAPGSRAVALSATFDDGFYLRSRNDRFKLRIGGIVQADARYFPGNTFAGPIDNFQIRTARLDIEGTIYDIVDFRFMPDFGQSQVRLQDAYVDVRFHRAIRLRAGKFKVPFGLERQQNEGRTAFMERGFPTSISPNRDVGAELFGDVAGGTFQWGLGVFNGGTDNGTDDKELDADKEGAARAFFQPWKQTSVTALRDLGFGGAASVGQLTGTPAAPQLLTLQTDGLNAFFKYAAPTTATVDNTTVFAGRRYRATAQAYYYYWRFSAMAEYTWNAQDVRIGPNHPRVQFAAWQGYLTFMLTDDRPTFDGVRPRRPLDIHAHGPGAWELGFRYSGITVSDNAFSSYAYPDLAAAGPNPASFLPSDPTKWARGASSYTVGLNWHLSANAKVQLNYVRTDFTGGAAKGGDRPSENALMARLQYMM